MCSTSVHFFLIPGTIVSMQYQPLVIMVWMIADYVLHSCILNTWRIINNIIRKVFCWTFYGQEQLRNLPLVIHIYLLGLFDLKMLLYACLTVCHIHLVLSQPQYEEAYFLFIKNGANTSTILSLRGCESKGTKCGFTSSGHIVPKRFNNFGVGLLTLLFHQIMCKSTSCRLVLCYII